MKKLLFLFFVLPLVSVAGEVAVKSVTAQQRYPWNGLVDVTVTIQGASDDLLATECAFTATDNATKEMIVVEHVTNTGKDSGTGNLWTRKFIWDAKADVGAVKIDDMVLSVGAYVSESVQLWEDGPYWATCNVGAAKPEECGYYFWWGDTVGYKRNANDREWNSVRDLTSFSFGIENCPTYNKSNSLLESEGYIDSTGNLKATHDAATAHLGVPWRMPTDAEFSALINNCDTEWTSRNGVFGRLVKGRGAYSSKGIFLPAAGDGHDSRISYLGSNGSYWSSTPYSVYPSDARYLFFGSSDFRNDVRFASLRYYGQSVRPVRGFGGFAAGMSPGVMTQLSLDCRAGAKVADNTHPLVYDATWYTDGTTAKITANGQDIVSGAAGTYAWVPLSDGVNLLTLNVYNESDEVVGMEQMFCLSREDLTELVIPEGTMEIGAYAFAGGQFTAVTVPNSVTNVAPTAFAGCANITSVAVRGDIAAIRSIFPDSYATIGSVEIGEGTTALTSQFFAGCESLTSVTLPSTLEDCGDNDLRWLAELSGQEGLVINGGWVIGCKGDAPSVLTIPEGVKGIAPWALSEQYDLEEVVLPSTLKTIGIGAFAGDTILGAVEIPDGVEKIDARAFKGCSWLTDVVFGSGLREIGAEAFSGCTRMAAVELPGTLAAVGEDAFVGIASLTVATVPTHLMPLQSLLPDSAATIEEIVVSEGSPEVCEEMFKDLAALKTVAFAASVTNVGARAFYGCSSIENIELGDAVEVIGDSAFRNCSRLGQVDFGPALRQIDAHAFNGCSALGQAELPGTVEMIGDSAFSGCSSLAYVSLGPKATTIGSSAFNGCRQLGWLTFPEGTTLVGDSVLYGCSALKSVGLPESVSDIRSSALRSTALTEIVLPAAVTNLGAYVFGWGSFARVCYLGDAPAYNGDLYSGTSSELVSCLVEKSYGWDGNPKSRAPVETWPTSNARAVEYTAQDLNRFAVTFNANGGTFDNGDGTTSESRQMTETQGFRYVFPSDVPRRDGFAFAGWTTDVSGGVGVAAGDVVSDAAAHVLYARWSPQFYFVSFDGNGGTGTMPDESFGFGETKSLTANAFERTGYRFAGWSRTTADVVDYSDGETVSRQTLEQAGTTVLRVVWTPNAYTVRFDCNGGSGSMDDQPFTYGVAQALRANAFTRVSYYFEGWATTATGETVYEDGQSVTDLTVENGATITLYAKWHPMMEISGTTVTVYGNTDMTVGEFTSNVGSITTIVIEEGVSRLPAGFFDGCDALVSVTMTDSLRATLGYDDLWPQEKAKAAYDADGFLMLDGWVLGYRDRQATRLAVPEGVVGIGAGAFADMADLAVVTLPESLVHIGAGAFQNDTFLDNLRIPDGVEVIAADAFRDCSYLQTLTMGGGVCAIGDRAFQGCTQLARFSAGARLETIGDCAFSNCWRMQSVSLPKGMRKVASTAFTQCNELTGLVVPTGVAPLSDWFGPVYLQIRNVTIPSGETDVCDGMFSGCTELTTIELPNGITNIAAQAFKGCSRIGELTLPQSVAAIGPEAFYGCTALVSLVVPEAVTVVGESAFRNCSGLADVTLSRNLTALPDYLFAGCSLLDSFTVPAAVTYLGQGFFPGRTTAIYYQGNAPSYHSGAYESASGSMKSYVRQGTKGWDGRSTSRDMPPEWPTEGSYRRAIAWWTPNQFDVTFDANGGIFAPVSASTYACEQITYTWYSLPPFEPTRANYKFNGYWTEPSGGTRIFTSTGVKLTKAHTLYAQWIKGSVVTVRFNPNGGTVNPDERNYTAGTPYGSFPVPTREHYVFVGWFTEASGGSQVVEASEVPGADRELFAHWTPCRYVIRFHANNGTSATADQSFAYGDAVTLRANTFSCPNCTFAGWALNPGAPAAYADRKTLTDVANIEDGVIHLWACWVGNTYAVRFDSHGGEGVIPNQTFVIGVAQSLTKNAFTREGFSFGGWALSTDEDAVYADGETVNDLTTQKGATVVLYAAWVRRDGVSVVTFEANGGELETNQVKYVSQEAYGELPTPTRTGYSFAAWETRGGTVVTATSTVPQTDTTLYATWTPNEYAIDFNPGRGGEGSMSDQPMTYDEAEALYLNRFRRTGYTFLGWTDDPDEVEAVLYYDGGIVENLTDEEGGEVDLYAIWAGNEYSVKFNANGGTGTMAAQEFLYDEVQNLTSNGFVRAGCEFLGWATSAVGEVVYADGETVSNLTATADGVVNLYAVWDGVATTWMEDEDFSATVANTYDGYMIDEDYNLLGIVQVKTTKQSVKTTTDKKTKVKTVTTNITATATVTDANGKKWSYSKGVVEIRSGASLTSGKDSASPLVGVVTGLKCTAKGCLVAEFGVKVGRNGMEGAWGEYAIFGARNGMGTKGDAMMAELEHYKGKWSVTIGTLRLQLNVQAKGVVKIAGNWESGAKVSASAQLVMGGGFVYVPVMVKQTKTSPALNALLRIDSNAAATGMLSPQAVTLLSGGELVAGGRTAEELGEPDYLPSAVSAGGKAFSARVAVNELAYPAKFAAKKLPTGLKIDAATGVISGTPTKPGHYVAEVTVTSGLNSKVKKTLTVEFDIANYTDDLIPIEDSYGPYYVGVSAVEQIAAAAGCTASGLPSGLKWTAKDIVDTKTKAVKTAANTVYGIPTKACTSTVYFKKTVKERVNGKQKSVTHQASATFIVEGMKPWAIGTFDGGMVGSGASLTSGKDSASPLGGMVQLTVSNVGKISGKWMSGGTNWTLSAASFDAFDAEREAYHATLTAKSGKETKTIEVEVTQEGVSGFSAPVAEDRDGTVLFEAWRNGWKEEPLKTLAKGLKGKKVSVAAPVAEDRDGTVELTVGASGAVTAKGTFVTGFDEKKQKDVIYSASCSTVLIPTETEGQYKVYLYFPPKSGKFGGFTGVVEIGGGEGE